jgi:glycosyltransferase involved in cell wall biosynthesis
MKVAIIHDWLVTYAGAEKVLEQLLKLYPQADIFTIVDFLPEKDKTFLDEHKITTSFIQKLPFAKTKYRNYLPLMPLAIEQFDLSAYDLVISSSHAVAKGVIVTPSQKHICYIHSPMRYAWDLQHQYLQESKLDKGLKGLFVKYLLHKMRLWDARTANGVDEFIANSHYIAKRVWRVYRRESTVIYPPVDVQAFEMYEKKEDYYFTASRMVPYKKIDLIVEAFAHMPDKKLIVIGDGPDMAKIKAKAVSNVILMGYQPFSVLKETMQKAKAFVFAAEEDFGIAPVEAQACGTPVIAFGKGGALETVIDGKTGVFFNEQTIESLTEAVQRFESMAFDISDIRANALRFSNERFLEEIKNYENI